MLSKIFKRVTYLNVIMTIALVFAMSGGAYAAKHYLITSTSQISPKVLKTLKGANGKAGANGAVGSVGSTGPAGAKGENGAVGKEGSVGKEGPQGLPGAPGTPGKDGKEGSPWTAGGTLPSEKTENGVWSGYGYKEDGEEVLVPISFTIPLASKPAGEEFVGAGSTGTHCTGSSAAPTAPPGYLCVYDEIPIEEEISRLHVGDFLNPQELNRPGASPDGALLELKAVIKEAGNITFAYGTWAVTAE